MLVRGVETLSTTASSIAFEAACTSTQLHRKVTPEGFAPTWNAAQLLAGGDQSPSFSLEAISERYVGVELDKEARRQDWSGKLSGEQLEYAARDAAEAEDAARSPDES